jgi:predicted PurR-regulated permease PerM
MATQTGRTHQLESRVTDLMIRLILLGVLVYFSLNLLRPFLLIFVWAIVLTVALFPFYVSLSKRLGGRHGLAALLITLVALLVVIGPVAALATSFVETLQWLTAGAYSGTLRVPPPPEGVASWPLIGDKVQEIWTLASTDLDALIHRYSADLLPTGQALLAILASLSADLLRIVFAVVLSGFLFGYGQKLASSGREIAARIIAPRGAMFVDLAGATIRNVSRGVVGVALLQTILAGVAMQVMSVPGAGLLAFGILILCLVQIGPLLIVLPVLIWAWFTTTTGAALIFTLVMVPIALLDNVLKPILMSRGLATPTLVIFLGVIGGTLTYGLIGLFLGPIVLSVFYDLLRTWVHFDPAQNSQSLPVQEMGHE